MKNLGGRPTKMTPETINKLETVFSIDGTVSEACFYADISKETYYNWLEKNPQYRDRFEALRNKPVLKARTTVVNSLSNPDHAFKYLSKKKFDEFGDKENIVHNTAVIMVMPEELINKNKTGSINAVNESPINNSLGSA